MWAREIREARLAHGLSLVQVGRRVGVSASTISRVERAVSPRVELLRLVRLCAAVGLDLSVRAYPGGQPIRDRAHLALLALLRAILHPLLRWRSEVPIPIAGDRRSWDAVVEGCGTIGIEAETRLRDVQAAERRLFLKKRDGGVDRVILVLSDTRWHRQLLRANPEIFDSFPIPSATALARLAKGEDPGGDAIVLL